MNHKLPKGIYYIAYASGLLAILATIHASCTCREQKRIAEIPNLVSAIAQTQQDAGMYLADNFLTQGELANLDQDIHGYSAYEVLGYVPLVGYLPEKGREIGAQLDGLDMELLELPHKGASVSGSDLGARIDSTLEDLKLYVSSPEYAETIKPMGFGERYLKGIVCALACD